MPMLSRRDLLFTATAAGSVMMALPVGRLAAQSARRPVQATFGPGIAVYAANMVAVEAGFAGKEGLDLKLVVTESGTQSRQLLAGGQALFGHGDTSNALQIANRGRTNKMLLSSESRASYANIVIRRDLFEQGLTSVEALGGWRRPDGSKPILAATAVGSGTWMFGTYIFETVGKGDAVTWVGGGNQRIMLGGLSSRQFDAIVAYPSWVIDAERFGWGRTIFDGSDEPTWNRIFGGSVPVQAVYALDQTIKNQPDLTQAYVNTIYAALQWLKQAAADSIVELIGEKYFPGVERETLVKEFEFYRAVWNFDGGVDRDGYERGGRIWFRPTTDIKPIAYTDAVNTGFLDHAKRKLG